MSQLRINFIYQAGGRQRADVFYHQKGHIPYHVPGVPVGTYVGDGLRGALRRAAVSYTHLGPKDPVIPGSEIRGAVRSVYEAAFGGCASTMRLINEI